MEVNAAYSQPVQAVQGQSTYTAEQVANILGVSIRTAYKLCETTKEFRVLRLGKRCLRIHKESFDNWLNGAGEADGLS
jgi:excisionase family DNA binding protein